MSGIVPIVRAIVDEDVFHEGPVQLRLVRVDDCGARYMGWLNDPEVNRYLETRWTPQSRESVESFVRAARASTDSYLFAIIESETGRHVGNIKVGPLHTIHGYADVSYFIGERQAWGKGYATAAIRGVSRLAFDRLGAHRLRAGVYSGNDASTRALEKVGYKLEGQMREQMRTDDGWVDLLWFGLLIGELREDR